MQGFLSALFIPAHFLLFAFSLFFLLISPNPVFIHLSHNLFPKRYLINEIVLFDPAA